MEGSMGAGALAREHECYAGGGCVRIELRAGGGGRRREAARVALQCARHTPPKLSTSARLHRAARAPPPPRSHTSLPAPREEDLPGALHLRDAASGHGHLPGPVHTRGAAPVEASGVHALRHRGTARSHHRRRGRGRCGGPAWRGGQGW
jgi:hypothetical protein